MCTDGETCVGAADQETGKGTYGAKQNGNGIDVGFVTHRPHSVNSDSTDMAAVDDTEAPTGSGAVHDGWANHFAAFGGQDVDKILLDYVEEFVITVYNNADGTSTTFRGLSGARDRFTGLFASLWDTSDLAAPSSTLTRLLVETLTVFLIWSAAVSGYVRAIDTFLFNAQGKITRQHVVVHYLPAQAGWG